MLCCMFCAMHCYMFEPWALLLIVYAVYCRILCHGHYCWILHTNSGYYKIFDAMVSIYIFVPWVLLLYVVYHALLHILWQCHVLCCEHCCYCALLHTLYHRHHDYIDIAACCAIYTATSCIVCDVCSLIVLCHRHCIVTVCRVLVALLH